MNTKNDVYPQNACELEASLIGKNSEETFQKIIFALGESQKHGWEISICTQGYNPTAVFTKGTEHVVMFIPGSFDRKGFMTSRNEFIIIMIILLILAWVLDYYSRINLLFYNKLY